MPSWAPRCSPLFVPAWRPIIVEMARVIRLWALLSAVVLVIFGCGGHQSLNGDWLVYVSAGPNGSFNFNGTHFTERLPNGYGGGNLPLVLSGSFTSDPGHLHLAPTRVDSSKGHSTDALLESLDADRANSADFDLEWSGSDLVYLTDTSSGQTIALARNGASPDYARLSNDHSLLAQTTPRLMPAEKASAAGPSSARRQTSASLTQSASDSAPPADDSSGAGYSPTESQPVQPAANQNQNPTQGQSSAPSDPTAYPSVDPSGIPTPPQNPYDPSQIPSAQPSDGSGGGATGTGGGNMQN